MTGVGSPRGLEGFLREQGKRLTAQEKRQTPSFSSMLRSIESLSGGTVGENLVPNPSFERGLMDWEQSGEDYSDIDTHFFRTGQSSLRSESDLRRASQFFAVQPGDTVRLTGYVASSGVTTAAVAGFLDQGWDGTNWAKALSLTSLPADSMWHRFSMDYIVPEGTTSLAVRLAAVMSNKDAGEAAWFDDISVRVLEDGPATSIDGRLGSGGLRNTGVSGSSQVSDANGVLESGWYWGPGSSANTPTNYNFVLEVRSFENGIRQVLTRLDSEYPGATWERASYDLGATWTAWSLTEQNRRIYNPSINAGLTIGNGSMSGEYTVAGGILFGQIRVSFGSTTAVASDIRFELPVAKTSGAYYYDSGRANFSGGSNYPMQVLVASYVYVRPLTTGTGGITATSANSSTPRSWNSGTVLDLSFKYPVGQAS